MKKNSAAKVNSVFAVDRETGVTTNLRFSPSYALALIIKGVLAPTNNEPDCNTVYFLTETPEQRQKASTIMGPARDPLRDLRSYRMVGSLNDHVIESSDVDQDYGMPVLPTFGYDRTTSGYSGRRLANA